MSENAPEKPAKSRWRKWLKRLFLGVCVFLLLLVAFHRPLFFHGVRIAAAKGGEAAGLKVDYQMGGTIFGSLRIWDLKVTPTRPGPVGKVDVGTIALEYSLIGLVRDGLAGFLKSVELADADVEINAVEKPPEEPKKKKRALRIPPLFPERLRIENINVVVHDPEKGDLIVREFDFILNPTGKGRFGVKQLTIPGVHEWKDVKAASATYRDRNLVLEQLNLDSEVQLSRLNLDASRLDDAELGLALEGAVFGGHVKLGADVTQLNTENLLKVDAALDGIELGRIPAYLGLDAKFGGTLVSAGIRFEGNPTEPKTWSGENSLNLSTLTFGGQPLVDEIALSLTLSGGQAKFQLAELRRATANVKATAQMELPGKIAKFPYAEMTGQLSVDAPSLADLQLGDQAAMEGAVTASGPFRMADGFFNADLKVEARGVQSEMVDAKTADLQVRVRKRLYKSDTSVAVPTSNYIRVANANANTGADADKKGEENESEIEEEKGGIGQLLQGLEFEITGEATGVRVRDYTVESATIDVKGKDGQIDLRTLNVREGENVFSLGGQVNIPADAMTFADASADVKVDLSAPVLREFVAEQTGVELEGALTVGGEVKQAGGKLNGALDIRGSDLKFAGLSADAVNVGVLITDNVVNIEGFEVVFDPKNRIDITGTVSLDKPISYKAKLDLKMPDLGVLNPLLAKQDKTIAGMLTAAWEGEGKLEGAQHSGAIDLEAKSVTFGEIVVSEAKIGGDYSPTLIDIPTFTVKSNQGDVGLKITLKDDHLQISELVASRGEAMQLTGEIGLPLVITEASDLVKMFPPEGKIDASISVKEIQLGPLLKKGDEPPALTGAVKATLTASGTIADFLFDLDVAGSNLQPSALKRLEPASLALSVKVVSDKLTVDGTVSQPEINPLTIKGELPLDLEKLLAERALDKTTPIQLAVTLPRSEFDFLTKMSPAVRFVEGSGTLNATVGGTIEAPELGGSLLANIDSLALRDSAVPPISDLVMDIRFADNRVSFNRVTALLAGGTLDLGGSVALEDLTNPVFDLRMVAENALVARNDTITVRVNTDVTVKGPLAEAAVGGSVSITNSRFFREIDILPLELPGQPAPAPPPTTPGISLDGPLANWNFDVAVTTKDPFLIRGNLANGGATVDLKLLGKGSELTLDGSVRIVDFVATLPFSTLRISNGFIYFAKAAPFEPRLDIRGVSELRNYRVSVYIYGPTTDIQTIFSSEPPLPQEDIISLLATGTTTEELSSGSGVVAGRAASLLARKLWGMVFKSKRKPGEPGDPFMDRLSVDIGAVDPKTGEQEVRATFKMTDRYDLIGGLDIRGNARGEVRYLIRFK